MSYARADTLAQALELIQGGPVDLVAGGTDYFPSRAKVLPTTRLLDVSRVAEMRGITRDGEGWRIGGAVTWSEVIAADLPRAFDGLKAAAREVGSVQIQNVGTLAGNLCNASPAADGVPPLLTLEALVELASGAGRRVVGLGDFITGVRRTVLLPGELVTAVLIPAMPEHARGAFQKLGSRRYLVISIAMVAAVVGIDATGRIDFARLAVGACSPVAQRQPALEVALLGQPARDVIVRPQDLQGLAPIDDVRGDAGYRLEAAAELCSRALREAAS